MSSKQVIIIRKDLKMRKGKMIAQGAHASLGAICNIKSLEVFSDWRSTGGTKICVSVDSLEELLELKREAEASNLPHYLVLDEGRTEFPEPTYTALAIGPAKVEDIDPITKDLKLL